jgi:outer membrane protein
MKKITSIIMATTIASGACFASATALSKEKGDLLIRARALFVLPAEKSTITPINGAITVENVVVPELDFTYFTTDNIAFELILATTKHDIGATGTTLGDLTIGSVKLLPPTLLAQFHFDPIGQVGPYVGAGINYTMFYGVKTNAAFVDSDYKNKFGFALQVGFDVEFGDKTYFNVDVKKLFLKTDAVVDAGVLGMVNADVKLNPWIIGIGFGKAF